MKEWFFYLKMSKKTAQQLLAIRTLFNDESEENIINFRYTKGADDHPEPILNLKWSISGEWKFINLLEKFSSALKASEIFNETLNIEPYSKEYDRHLRWLFDLGITTEVRAVDFKSGIDSIFKNISKIEKCKNIKQSIPTLIVRKNSINSFFCYYYDNKQKKFVRVGI